LLPFELPLELAPPEELPWPEEVPEEPPPEEVPEEPPLDEVPEEPPPDEELDEELELLEVEDPPPEEETAGPPSWPKACCRWVTTVLTAGPRVATVTTTAKPMAAAINAYSTAAAPAASPIRIFLVTPPCLCCLYQI
jgi:hypothetical protein